MSALTLIILLIFSSPQAFTQPSTQVTFEWTPVDLDINGNKIANLKEYRIYISKYSVAACPSPSSSPSSKGIVQISTPAKATTVSAPLPPGYYFATVTAVNTAGESQKSNELSFYVPEPKPQAPIVKSAGLP